MAGLNPISNSQGHTIWPSLTTNRLTPDAPLRGVINLRRSPGEDECCSYGPPRSRMLATQIWITARLARVVILIIFLSLSAAGNRNAHDSDFQRFLAPGRLSDSELAPCALHSPHDWQSLPPQCKTFVKTAKDRKKKPIGGPPSGKEPLVPLVFEPLPLGSIKPLGWLHDQLQLMADGLPGHEYDFYHLVRHNPWLGGSSEYSPLNEAFPYWFNGLVPLAYGINDERLKKQVLEAAEYIISHQHNDGWLGPEVDKRRRNFWGRYPVFLALAQLVEVTPNMTDQRAILPAMHRFVDLMHSMLSDRHRGFVWHPGDLFDEQWGRSRTADMVLALQWLYENHPSGNEKKIYDCMRFFHEQAYDWSYWFSEGIFIKDDLDLWPVEVTNSFFPFVHGVNAAQGLKAGAVMRRLTHDEALLETTRNGVNWTFTYHGTPSGGIIGDERLSGLSPVRGVELCSVVETMFSLSYLYQAMGDKDFADRCERTAFNALPAMVMPDWWAHQYVSQTNQPVSHELARSPFWNVGVHGQRFGLQLNYPCCTVDFPQGYPKFLSASFTRSGSSGIAHALLSPAEVSTQVGNGSQVHISCKTNYPFNHLLYYNIELDQGSFWFSIRVPTWAVLNRTTISINGAKPTVVSPDGATGMHSIFIKAGKTIVIYEIGADIRLEPRANNTVAVYHGALLYSISIFGEYISHAPSGYPVGSGAPLEASDWTITPRSPWAVAIDVSTLKFWEYPNRDDEQPPNPIWAENAPPVGISALACEIGWETVDGYATNPPLNRTCTSRAFMIELKPYGAAKLHVAEIPVVDLRFGTSALANLET